MAATFTVECGTVLYDKSVAAPAFQYSTLSSIINTITVNYKPNDDKELPPQIETQPDPFFQKHVICPKY